jgi:alkylation response protein AidB-like acyl-CoA dehydrogenase
MIEWSEQHQMIREAVRRFVEAEVVPNLEALEHGDTPPYDVLRKMIRSFGMDEMARSRFEKQVAREALAGSAGPSERADAEGGGRGDAAAMQLIPIIELCRFCPGMVTAMGVSMGLTAGAILSKGTLRQKKRWALDLLTLDKVGAWAITEPGSGSDAFGSMRSTARRDGDGGYVLNGNKTFITNGPFADTIVFICKLEDEGVDPKDRKVLTFVLDRGMQGLTQSKPMRKMGLHSSPTGELFLNDVRVSADRLLGEAEDRASRSGAKTTFSLERTGVAAMALGIIERCLELSLAYAKERVQFGRPIGEFQLIQEKLARMEVWPSKPCRSTVATATCRSIRSSSSRETPRSSRSTRARTRSRFPPSPGICWRGDERAREFRPSPGRMTHRVVDPAPVFARRGALRGYGSCSTGPRPPTPDPNRAGSYA